MVFQVPEFMVDLLNSYIFNETIDLNRIVESAIKKYYGRVMINTHLSIDYNDYEEETFPLKVTISKGLADDLALRACVAHSSISAILVEVLFILFEELEFAFDTIGWYGLDSILKDDIKTKVVA